MSPRSGAKTRGSSNGPTPPPPTPPHPTPPPPPPHRPPPPPKFPPPPPPQNPPPQTPGENPPLTPPPPPSARPAPNDPPFPPRNNPPRSNGVGNPRSNPRPPHPGTRSQDKSDHEILFQQFFKSVGPRTYAAQVKQANNGNHYLVLTEGKRDEKTGDLRKSCLYVYSEDFVAFFQLVKETSLFIKANPLPPEVKAKRNRFWSKQDKGGPRTSHQPKPSLHAPLPAVPIAPAPSTQVA